LYVKYDTGSSGDGAYSYHSADNYDTPEDWGDIRNLLTTEKWSLYATYEAAATGTNMQLNISDSWKEITKVQINIGDSWKNVTKAQVNIGDEWKTIF